VVLLLLLKPGKQLLLACVVAQASVGLALQVC
jgi:hypothetical protein